MARLVKKIGHSVIYLINQTTKENLMVNYIIHMKGILYDTYVLQYFV